LVDDCFDELRGTTRDQINFLAAALDAPSAGTQETISFSYDLGGIVPNSTLVVGDETLYVITTNPSALTAVVVRGWDNTTPATAALGASVLVDPPWTRSVVTQRIRDEIRSWGPQVFAIKQTELTMVLNQRGYDFSVSDQVIDVLRITAQQVPTYDPLYGWNLMINSNTTQAIQEYPFRYDAKADTSVFPSGRAIYFTDATPAYNGNINVIYSCAFDVDTSWNDSTDMLTQVGLDSRDLDIPKFGAIARLLKSMMVRRSMLNVMGQSREDQDVSMATIGQAATEYRRTADLRLADVRERQLTDWPYRSTNF